MFGYIHMSLNTRRVEFGLYQDCCVWQALGLLSYLTGPPLLLFKTGSLAESGAH